MIVERDEIQRAFEYHKLPKKWHAKVLSQHRTCDVIQLSKTQNGFIAYVSPICDAVHISSMLHASSINKWKSLYSMQYDMEYLSAIIIHEHLHMTLNRLGEYKASQNLDTFREAWAEDNTIYMNFSYLTHAMLQ